MPKLSPLAPAHIPAPGPLAGVRLAATASGIRYSGRTDLCLIELAPGTTVAGVLTRSLTASAPVDWCRASLKRGRARAIVVNSGNSNAFTGKLGREAVKKTVDAACHALGAQRHEVYVASTGVIGEPLPAEKIAAALPALRGRLSADGWSDAARAIMTTDTFPKLATRPVEIDGVPVTLTGMAKGSGMIAPDMATMLAFAFTDAAIPAPVLRQLLTRANDRSFNAITVDGDTSTSDTLLLCATGRAKHKKVRAANDAHLRAFRKALDELLIDLAHQVVRDGEGASKFVSITVTGAASAGAARRIGLAVANSPLVKTAIAGEDANWGRIVMAVGKAGEKADRDKLAIRIGGVHVAEGGLRVPDYDEAPVAAHMKGQEIAIEVDVGVGRGRATVWTCDLTHGYIEINADYRS
ncbi:MAG TPA: bifunctional glutamate N-acetyltransferase/amino-acid acetyltransferase ArgJ [Alphaproteobacteria bacterium]|jgi:glutamate N-acetyltransferase/amino-acid N-acetyltransferase|nr:bifunctional glutamate N-acetyltransferase/amino-acid acetyltransferase ArgJ [Alphaproteobacteria bacterium]